MKNSEQLIDLVRFGLEDAVLELLKKTKLDVNEKDSNGNFAAIMAAERNDLAMLKLLVEYGAKLDLKDGCGLTVKDWASDHKNTEMIEFINNKTKAEREDDSSDLYPRLRAKKRKSESDSELSSNKKPKLCY